MGLNPGLALVITGFEDDEDEVDVEPFVVGVGVPTDDMDLLREEKCLRERMTRQEVDISKTTLARV